MDFLPVATYGHIPSRGYEIAERWKEGTGRRGEGDIILAVEAVELSHAWEVLIDGELLGFSVLALVGQLDELVVDGIVGLEEELAAASRLVREAALLDLAVRAFASHLDEERRRRRLGFSFGSRTA